MFDSTTASAYDFEDVGSVTVTGGGNWFSTDEEVTKTTSNSYNHEIEDFKGNKNIEDTDTVALEKECRDRLSLLAQSYGDKVGAMYKRDISARIEILEKTIESAFPRYDEGDWELLEKFSNSIQKLNSPE